MAGQQAHPPQEVLVAHYRGRGPPDYAFLGPGGTLLIAMSDDEATHPESDGSAHVTPQRMKARDKDLINSTKQGVLLSALLSPEYAPNYSPVPQNTGHITFCELKTRPGLALGPLEAP